jgi:hypothetical protein
MHVTERLNCIPTQNFNRPIWKKTANMKAFGVSRAWLPWQRLLPGCNLPVRFELLAEHFRNKL